MPKRLPPIHPGEHLQEFLTDFGLTKNQFAKALHVPPNRITAIINGTRGISAETAMRLARYFGTSVQMWMNLQAHYEMEVARDRFEVAIRKEVKPRPTGVAA
jgi:addiction module HigA family antidote